MRRIFKPEAKPWVRVAFIVAALAGWAGGLVALIAVGSEMWRMERLRRDGVVVVGKITYLEPQAIVIGNMYRVAYSFPAKIPAAGTPPPTVPVPVPVPKSPPDILAEGARGRAQAEALLAGRDPDPNEIRVQERIPWDIYNPLHTGQEILVTVLPGRPEVHEIGRVDTARVWSVPSQDANFRLTGYGLILTVTITLVFAYVLLAKEPKGKDDWQ
jgi:hypothetical protein